MSIEKLPVQKNAVRHTEESQLRPPFEQFKSNVCHRVKDMGDIPFLIQLLESNQIRELYEKNWYPEALYLLAMLDYLSRENSVPLCKNYNDIRAVKLQRPVYPSSVVVMCEIMNSDAPKEECCRNAIPEFLRFNIVECDVRNVCWYTCAQEESTTKDALFTFEDQFPDVLKEDNLSDILSHLMAKKQEEDPKPDQGLPMVFWQYTKTYRVQPKKTGVHQGRYFNCSLRFDSSRLAAVADAV